MKFRKIWILQNQITCKLSLNKTCQNLGNYGKTKTILKQYYILDKSNIVLPVSDK